MYKTKFDKVLVFFLAVLLVFLTFSSNQTSAKDSTATSKVSNVEHQLANLSKQQRKALKKLKAKPAFKIAPNINTKSSDPVHVIVEFKQDPAKVDMIKHAVKGKRMALSSAENKVERAHETFKRKMNLLTSERSAKHPKKTKITREYRHAINGVAMKLPGTKVKDLLGTGVVKRVWKDSKVKLNPPKGKKKSPIQTKMANSNHQINVDQLHEEGITGKGVKVGVIDTGIDYHHPDLEKAYAGYRAKKDKDPSKVDPDSVKGWDFVDNDADPMETTYKEWKDSGQPEINPVNGETYYTEHGTHVSGIIAGQGKADVDYAVEGVAPDADVYVYRVLGPYGSGPMSDVISGINKSIKDEMDVINLSLGDNTNDPLTPTAVAVNNAMLSGVVTAVAAGNAGPNEKTLGSPGTAALAISVGASDVAMDIPTFSASAGGQEFNDMNLLAMNFSDQLKDLKGESYSVVNIGLGQKSDVGDKDLKGKIALVQRGDITFNEKIKNAAKAGARAVLLYNNEKGDITDYLGRGTGYVPTFALSKTDGEKLKELEASGNLSFTFQKLGSMKTDGDHLADFSSRGPVAKNYDIKPDIVAPGVSIFSTLPAFVNDPDNGKDYSTAYGRLSGTSMATPNTVGVAALILQAHPKDSPFEVKTALMNSADDLNGNYSVYEVGAGRIDAYASVHADSSVTVMDKTKNEEDGETVEIADPTGSISFGSSYQQDGSQAVEDSRKVTINNDYKTDKTFDLDTEFLSADEKVKDADKNGVKMKLPKSISVSAGQSKNIQPTIHVPAKAEFGRYEGYIHVTNQQNEKENYKIPFAIRYTNKGIDYVRVYPPSLTNTTPYHAFLRQFSIAQFKLKSKMKTIDLIAKDEKTGDPVGFVGTMDADNTDVDKELGTFFKGLVYPFTDDPENPVSDEYVPLPEGHYQLEMIATDDQGKTYKKDGLFVVDNTPPKMTFKDLKPGIHEVDPSMYSNEDGDRAVWVHTNVYDSTIDYLNSKGEDYDQSENTLAYHQDSPFPGTIPVEANGDAKFGIPPEEIADGPTTVDLMPVDMATAADLNDQSRYKFWFIKKGSEYGVPTYDTDEVRLGDTFTTTLTLNHVKKLLHGTFGVEYDKKLYKFVDVKATKALKKYANEKGIKISLDQPKIKNNDIYRDIVKVGASLKKDGFKGLNGDMPFLDITFKVTGDDLYSGIAALNVKDLSYKKVGSDETANVPVLSYDTYHFISKHSTVDGYIFPEAFLREDGDLSYDTDFSSIGAKVYVEAPDGKKYNGTIDEHGHFKIDQGIPAIKDDYKLIVKVPGHLTSVNPIKLSKKVDDERVGIYYTAHPEPNVVGDVNQDKKIDIFDVMRAVGQYGKKGTTKADINQDGKVDETDVRYIEKNFLKIGPDASENAQPQEKLGGKGLKDFLRAIGLKPKN